MENTVLDINEADFLNGSPLYESIFKFGDADLIQKYRKGYDSSKLGKNLKDTKEGDWLGFIGAALTGINELQGFSNNRKGIIEQLKVEITELIKNGDLIPFGFQLPRDLKDTPVKLPIDLFLSGEINWDESELIYKDLEFAGIRLINKNTQQNQYVKISNENNEIKPEKENKSEEIIKKNSFSNYEPDSMIGEKEVAPLLDVSVKTLQGWRYKGGGPEYHKIGKKTVKYKIADLMEWRDSKKKRNTSEY